MMRVKTITHTLKYLFSNPPKNIPNPPKNIPKPSPVEFDFKIPQKTHTFKAPSQAEVKITKAKRHTDASKILKKKQ